MKWEDRQESENVEDRRGMSGGAKVAIGGGGALILLVLALLLGVDPQQLVNLGGQGQGQGGGDQPNGQVANPQEDRAAAFAKTVFRDTEIVWDDQFRKLGKEYPKPILVLYDGYVESACGFSSAATGPFYCPGDVKVYLDLSFFKDMDRKLNAPGEFAHAYVIAHEVGHHVQRLLGYSQRVDDGRRARGEVEQNRITVRLELQADFLAGVWAHHAQQKFHFLERGDMESALNAAFQIGDDRLQKKARGYVVPDAFTHGTSKQRMRWFENGFKTGDVHKARLLFDKDYSEL